MRKMFLLCSIFLFLGINVAFAASYQVKFVIKDDGDAYGQNILTGYLQVFNCNSNREAENQARSRLSFDSSGKRRVNGSNLRLIIEQTLNISEADPDLYADVSSNTSWICQYSVIDIGTYEVLESLSQIQVDGVKTAREAFNRARSKLNFDSESKRRVSGRVLKIIPSLLQHN